MIPHGRRQEASKKDIAKAAAKIGAALNSSVNPDPDELARFATAHGRVLITSNIADFVRLHTQWLHEKISHSGIIVIRQQKWGPGELARRIIRVLAHSPGADMRNRLEFQARRREPQAICELPAQGLRLDSPRRASLFDQFATRFVNARWAWILEPVARL